MNQPHGTTPTMKFRPDLFKCIVCNRKHESLIDMHLHQTACHTSEELSLSVISIQSLVYHQNYCHVLTNEDRCGHCHNFPFCNRVPSSNGQTTEEERKIPSFLNTNKTVPRVITNEVKVKSKVSRSGTDAKRKLDIISKNDSMSDDDYAMKLLESLPYEQSSSKKSENKKISNIVGKKNISTILRKPRQIISDHMDESNQSPLNNTLSVSLFSNYNDLSKTKIFNNTNNPQKTLINDSVIFSVSGMCNNIKNQLKTKRLVHNAHKTKKIIKPLRRPQSYTSEKTESSKDGSVQTWINSLDRYPLINENNATSNASAPKSNDSIQPADLQSSTSRDSLMSLPLSEDTNFKRRLVFD